MASPSRSIAEILDDIEKTRGELNQGVAVFGDLVQENGLLKPTSRGDLIRKLKELARQGNANATAAEHWVQNGIRQLRELHRELNRAGGIP